MLFTDEHFGKPISVELSEYLKAYTDKNDIVKVHEETGISQSTLIYVIRRTNSLTADNSKGIIKLMRIAVQNCTNKIEYSKRAKSFFENELQTA